MALVRPFCALRPKAELAAQTAALPYDVYSREEARLEAGRNPLSFLNIDRGAGNLQPGSHSAFLSV